MTAQENAVKLLKDWKKDSYIFGSNVVGKLGELVRPYGKKVLLVGSSAHHPEFTEKAIASLKEAGIELLSGGMVKGARPNAPREDVYRLESWILHYQPEAVVCIGGGSAIDACKAAIALSVLGKDVTPEIDHYFGTGVVAAELEKTGKKMLPLIAVETASSSGAHLTKYSNITDPVSGQKKLIVDNAIVPPASLFDYDATHTMPGRVLIDGALDGIAHTVEVFLSANASNYALAEEICRTALDLIFSAAKKLIEAPEDKDAHEALGLATDLGGYAIMIGGTSGAHLTSFSLVDVTAHGTACGIMNPYYIVFYAPAVRKQLLSIAEILQKHGLISGGYEELNERALAIAVAEGFISFSRAIGAPVSLGELPGFTDAHVDKILTAAKDPQLKMKLQNMPIPMTADDVYPYMESVILAAKAGNPELVMNK